MAKYKVPASKTFKFLSIGALVLAGFAAFFLLSLCIPALLMGLFFARIDGSAGAPSAPTHRYGFIDVHGVQVIPSRFVAVSNYKERLAAVCVMTGKAGDDIGRFWGNGQSPCKWGFIRHDGTWAIPAQFDTASDFSEGLAAVSNHGRYFYIDNKGNRVGENTFAESGPFKYGRALVRDSAQSPFSIIDRSGKVLATSVPIDGMPDNRIQDSFSDHLAIGVQHNYINDDGKVAFAGTWDSPHEFREGLAAASPPASADQPGSEPAKVGYLDTRGHWAIEPRFSAGGNFNDGLAYVIPSAHSNFGFINKSGELVIAPRYELCRSFSEGMAAVSYSAKPQFGFIDKQGRQRIKTQFHDVRDFHDGLALVNQELEGARPASEPHGDSGYIDTTGKLVIKSNHLFLRDFSEQLAAVGD